MSKPCQNMYRTLLGIKQLLHQPLIYNAVYILGINLIPGFAGIIFWGIASQLTPVSEVGKASAVFAAVALISGLASLGTSMSVIRFLPESKSPNRFLNTIYTFNLVISSLAALMFLAGMKYWTPGLVEFRINHWFILGFLVFVISATVGMVVRDTFIAIRRASYSLAYTLISNILRLVLVFFGAKWGAIGITTSTSVAFLFALLVSWLVFLPRLETGYHVNLVLNLQIIRGIIPFSLGNYVSTLLLQMPQTVLPLLLLEMVGAEANGYAYIGLMLGAVIPSPGLALANSAFAEGANDPANSKRLLAKALLIGVITTTAIATLVIVFPTLFLWIFGTDYRRESAALLQWLALASPFIVFNHLYFTLLRLEKKILKLIVLSCVIAGMTLVVTYILLPKVGISASGIGILCGNLATIILIFSFYLYPSFLYSRRSKPEFSILKEIIKIKDGTP